MMKFSLDWYDTERTILYLSYEGVWEYEVAQRAVDEYMRKVREVSHLVDLIAHALDREAMHLPFWLLGLGVRSIKASPPNAGMIAMVPNTTRILALTDAGIRVLGARYRGRLHTAATLDEAYQLILDLRKP